MDADSSADALNLYIYIYVLYRSGYLRRSLELRQELICEKFVHEQTDHELQLGEQTDHELQLGEQTDHELQLGEQTDHELQLGEQTDHELQLGEQTDHELQLGEQTDHELQLGEQTDHELQLGPTMSCSSVVRKTNFSSLGLPLIYIDQPQPWLRSQSRKISFEISNTGCWNTPNNRPDVLIVSTEEVFKFARKIGPGTRQTT